MSVLDNLGDIQRRALEAIAQSDTSRMLEEVRVAFSGKKGELTGVLRGMGQLSPEERPQVGKVANEVRQAIEDALRVRKEELAAAELAQRMAAESVDVTLPGRARPVGHQHLINSIIEEIEDFFVGLGYTVEDGPRIETEYYNFTALNTPPDHPSRSARDTFYIVDESAGADGSATTGVIGESNVLLRTQTSGVQARTMELQKPPIYMICPGSVFRPDAADPNHLPQFHQVEGLVVDRGITFGDLKGTLDEFCRAMFGQDRATRYRPHFFPFTEPSCEVDVSCNVCHGKGCRFCKNTGWLEILGCGMVDPNVLQYGGIDPEDYSGFAFGIGVERVACLRYDLPDLRMLVEGDMRFLKQF